MHYAFSTIVRRQSWNRRRPCSIGIWYGPERSRRVACRALPAILKLLRGGLVFASYFVEHGQAGFDVIAARFGNLAVEVVLAAQPRARRRQRRVSRRDHRERIPLDELAGEQAHPDRGERRPAAGEHVHQHLLILGKHRRRRRRQRPADIDLLAEESLAADCLQCAAQVGRIDHRPKTGMARR